MLSSIFKCYHVIMLKAKINVKYANCLILESGIYIALHNTESINILSFLTFQSFSHVSIFSYPLVGHNNIMCLKRSITTQQNTVKICTKNNIQ